MASNSRKKAKYHFFSLKDINIIETHAPFFNNVDFNEKNNTFFMTDIITRVESTFEKISTFSSTLPGGRGAGTGFLSFLAATELRTGLRAG